MNELEQKIQEALRQGLDALANWQEADGGFVSYSSSDPSSFNDTAPYHTTFHTSFILDCLTGMQLGDQQGKDEAFATALSSIKEKTAAFLLAQQSPLGSYNYWQRGSAEAKRLPYPDDADDTFCALAALYKYDRTSIDGRVLAGIVKILTAIEEKPGGPYRTWLVPADAPADWKDVDVAVNANIAHFLSLQGVHLPDLIAFLLHATTNDQYGSRYYSSPYPPLYFLSRLARTDDALHQAVLDALQRQLANGGRRAAAQSPLVQALMLCTFFNLGAAPTALEQIVDSLLASRHSGGGWAAYAFCLDPAQEGRTFHSGSPALTTAFALQALSLARAHAYPAEHAAATPATTTPADLPGVLPSAALADVLYESVVQAARLRFSFLEEDLQQRALACLDETLGKRDHDRQIILLPLWFKQSLGEKGEAIDEEMLVQLGLANLYGWIAYTIYDDILDDEGDAALLSLANVCLRELSGIYNSLPAPFLQLMDTVDGANTREQVHWRVRVADGAVEIPAQLPDYTQITKLADRSIGHALGPVAILLKLGYVADSDEVLALLDFFRHYLAARQLNDDAHDWERDLQRGQINSVGCFLLAQWRVAHPDASSLSLRDDMLPLKQLFWERGVSSAAEWIKEEVSLARNALGCLALVEDKAALEGLLVSLEKAADKAASEAGRLQTFLLHFAQAGPPRTTL